MLLRPRPYAEGPKDARVVLIGQNPGREEVLQNRPFVGRAGRYLDQVLMAKGIERNRLYITPVVKIPTPRNRKPTAKEIREWMPDLLAEIREIAPEIVVLMGAVARLTPRIGSAEYMETCHPAAAMRFPGVREIFEADMEILAKKIREKKI